MNGVAPERSILGKLLFASVLSVPLLGGGAAFFLHHRTFGTGSEVAEWTAPAAPDRRLAQAIRLEPEMNPMRAVLKVECHGITACTEQIEYTVALKSRDGKIVFNKTDRAYLGPTTAGAKFIDYLVADFSVPAADEYSLEASVTQDKPLNYPKELKIGMQLRARASSVQEFSGWSKRIVIFVGLGTLAAALLALFIR